MAIRTIFSCLSTFFKNYKLYIVGYWIIGVGWLINPFMHNVVKWPNILWKSCGVNTAGFLKYIWPFYNIMHERVKKGLEQSTSLTIDAIFFLKMLPLTMSISWPVFMIYSFLDQKIYPTKALSQSWWSSYHHRF